ncbi:hypothetical protein NDU88_001989 [Pleurodeles waltl]|uniref:Uncharacterized protein n=1 Tax=Pleurodeles waltl TaxID=8319 RepID=A0AAV7MN27_PLEWA|nr:hypothetical protein NDU88_001989 [Pleurodeles waltl]
MGQTGPTRTPGRLVLTLPCTTRKHPRERGSRLAPYQNRATRCRLKGRNRTLRGGEGEIHGGDRRRRRESQEQNSRGQGPKTSWKTPGPVSNNLESSGSLEPCGFNNAKRITGPGKQTNELSTLQEKRGQARYGNSGREGKRSGRREEDREENHGLCTKGGEGKKITGFGQKGVIKEESSRRTLMSFRSPMQPDTNHGRVRQQESRNPKAPCKKSPKCPNRKG